MRAVALAVLLASPAAASGDAVAAWSDLHGRCVDAVSAGAMLDVSGLEPRDPPLIADVVEEPPFGVRIEYDALRTSARIVPTGIWAPPGGRFEMQVLDYPTQAGVRSICEVSVAHGAATLDSGEADEIIKYFNNLKDEAVAGGGFSAEDFDAAGETVRLGITAVAPNPRDCPVVVSLTVDPARGFFRSSAAEGAAAPGCGGPSLAPGGLTRSPASLAPRGTP